MTGWTKLATVVAVAAILAITTGGAGATTSPGGGVKASANTAPRSAPRFVAPPMKASSRAATRSRASTRAAHRVALLRHANLKTVAGVKRYLRAIGVDPRGVVIQRGARNYAGPSCPGVDWACTSTAHPVVQIARAGGKNTFLCTTGNCAVVQSSGSRAVRAGRALTAAAAVNTAKCIKTTGLTQSCSINQTSTSDDNKAVVVENAGKRVGVTQTASYTASITQSAGSGHNRACVDQEINMDGSSTLSGKKGSGINVALEAHQSITITQNSASGGNDARESASVSTSDCTGTAIVQNQTLTSSSTSTGGGPIVQNENAVDGGANITLDIEQNQSLLPPTGSASGANNAFFNQTSNLGAVASTTSSGSVKQTQSSPSGGLLAKVNQYSTDKSTANAVQTETQCEHAQVGGTASGTCTPGNPPSYTLVQKQFGPISTGSGFKRARGRSLAYTKKGNCPPDCSVQTGNNTDTFTVTQTSTQNSDSGATPTTDAQACAASATSCTVNLAQADCATTGQSCHVDQTANAAPTNTQDAQEVNTQTKCSSSSSTSCTSGGTTTTGTLTTSPTNLSVSNTDVGEFGVGGMRGGNGSSLITVNLNGSTPHVLHAFLYWNGPTNSTNSAANASVVFNGQAVTGATNIGFASPNCWSFQNSQSYRADVTPYVTGSGTYTLSGFTNLPDVDINGVSLIVFYDDGNSANDRNFVAWNGNDSNVSSTFEPAGWNETISGVPYPGGNASLDTVVADGQLYDDPALIVNGTNTVAPDGPIFQGDSVPPSLVNGLWDVKSFDITSLLSTNGPNNLTVTSGDPFAQPNPSPNNTGWDCLSLVVAAANVPAAAPLIP